MNARVPALLTVLSGSFKTQPLAFAALLDEAEQRGTTVDLAEVDVIQAAAEVRLAHYFRPAIVARIERLRSDDNTVMVLRPCELAAARDFPRKAGRVRMLGRFAGEIIEPFGSADL